ncbi:tRNA dihydrouridine synthase DusB [Desulforamulus hydrothermalis]|uniref:tRNA-dihydrouridine synthase n=1 Tax=Desulforamulus hydrothermalis Lam5 = DSM 18033 TaxID=1121428 RepID=K8EAM3_9FIRM|nr:tRNA dihydrouridine synthase DusB [Desulforamulus hydrothermalis]CCO08688.1 putative tRNA-dihydrouridine synthase 1 [Desulforamulus hydrothermalis Lam5 = DSM 18033]SHH38509.1 tRNA-U20-dihydrouridine synthase [Desulforamulus hydrothermalis Lam5 = DSM 18033]
MQIGSVKLPNPVIAAPMAGVTDRAFRIIAREMGCALAVTEMVSDLALLYANPRTYRMLDFRGEAFPLSVQIFGSQPDTMGQAAAIVVQRGANMIDINMGCPTPKIVKNGEGSALMKNPALAGKIVEAVVRAVPGVPVTVKMRKGWDEHSVNAVELARIVEAAGASAVTVHGRTRNQFYSGRADWDIIRQVKEALQIPVIGNGDIWAPRDAMRMLQETGCDGIMVGRAAMGNPWIFRDIVHFLATGEELPPPTTEERINTALRHLALMVESKGEQVAVFEMRKHAAWYTKGCRGAARIRESINKSQSRKEIEDILKSLL